MGKARVEVLTEPLVINHTSLRIGKGDTEDEEEEIEDIVSPSEEHAAPSWVNEDLLDEEERDGEDSSDPLDQLVRRTQHILASAQDILKTTRSSRAHFSRFLKLDEALEGALRREVQGSCDIDDQLEELSRRVELFAAGKDDSEDPATVLARRQGRVEDVVPADPRSFLRSRGSAPVARPPRLQTMYLNAESTLDPSQLFGLSSPDANLSLNEALPRQHPSTPDKPAFSDPWSSSSARLLGKIMEANSPQTTPSPSPSLPSPTAASLLHSLAASTPPSRLRSVSLSHAPALPSPLGSPGHRRASTTSLASPSSSYLSPPLSSSRAFTPIAELDDDEDSAADSSSLLTPATSRSPSPLPPAKQAAPTPPPPRPLLHRHSRNLSTAGQPTAPKLSGAATTLLSIAPPSLVSASLASSTAITVEGASTTTPATPISIGIPKSNSNRSLSSVASGAPASPSAGTFGTPRSSFSGPGEDLTRVHAKGDVRHRRTESGLKERLEAMRNVAKEESAMAEAAGGGWWGSWR
ncbi:hypothetical protein T439DRAFT_324758 [Meredithblackwellia eburnea MCA 4105]